MTQTVEINLGDLLNKIDSKIDNLEQKINNVQIDVEKIKIQNQQIDKKFDDIDKKFDEVNSRLNTMTVGFLGIVGVLVADLLGIITKIALFPNV